jgi:hypothetical protein
VAAWSLLKLPVDEQIRFANTEVDHRLDENFAFQVPKHKAVGGLHLKRNEQ